MWEFVFAPQPVPAAAIHGQSERFPINRIFCVGRNYEEHAKEMGVAVDREAPFYFTKSPGHFVASGTKIAYPPGTKNYHYEMELVAVIGKAGFQIPKSSALEHVYGYACGLDMTRRDLQLAARELRRPWDLGKDLEESAVLGEIYPANEIGHLAAGRIELRVNGETKQLSDLKLLIHNVAEIVSHLSNYYHLEPGDVIYTGTPAGVGPVVSGDRLEGSIEGLSSIDLTIA